ncbi:TPA: ComEA family DNA-binding protein [Aeromonas salmonicida]|jgi:competence protein ComEA|uniref:ComEA family DNA-binding protein n=4 Tax=Bacteria TaxID=2 RepID=A0A3L0W4K6_ECOLX|nr:MULTISPECIES: ComEA family DNA-binding protein [Aeromonas]MBP8158759.1 ComEA family DNA-binding protein [Aeromonas sp.]ATP10955.1 YbaV family protein YbaV [Aeromonas salmonicida subsp. pectinolytica 34mel]EQC03024.1 ComEA protein [Aeromonas salmonicida subsp. pectinolytica 34mel]KTA78404.1 competence protein ComEA [Aeromonas salmonicida]MCE9970903.1 ComEA family DNA-binding protein [Aeromonas salmonicida]
MNYKTLTATLLLSCLPLLSQPLLAADKPAAKPATTVTTAKESGKVNLNTASINELTALKGIGEKKAQAIVDFREKQGKFTTVEQLADVSGIGPATLEANRDMIIVK